MLHETLYNESLITEDQREHIDIVLVSPRNPLNIGAAARAMANFGFSRLSVAAPYLPHWREARSAVGAPDVLEHATELPTLAAAIAECTLVAGTGTLTYRKPEQPVVALPELPALVRQEIERGGRVGLVFGPEKHGLTREDLSWCQVLVEIPTDPRQPSINLGQAVAVCLYELTRNTLRHDERRTTAGPLQSGSGNIPGTAGAMHANSANLDVLAAVIERTMIAANYSPRSMHAANRHDLRLLLRRFAPSSHDVRRMLGLFRRILWRLEQHSDQTAPGQNSPDQGEPDHSQPGESAR